MTDTNAEPDPDSDPVPLEELPEAYRQQAEVFETMEPPLRDFSFAHALRDCAEDVEAGLERLQSPSVCDADGLGNQMFVATFRTDMVFSDEASTDMARVFEIEGFLGSNRSAHELIQSHLEERYGTVEDLRIHPTRVRPIDASEEVSDR